MQRIVVKSVVTKPTKTEGTNITTIEDEKGAKMSAFNDPKLAELHSGDVIEVDYVASGKYLNITGWKIIESKPAPVVVKPHGGELFPEVEKKPPWKDNTASIESQVAFKGAVELICAYIHAFDAEDTGLQAALRAELADLQDRAFLYIRARLPIPDKSVTTPKPSEPASVKESASSGPTPEQQRAKLEYQLRTAMTAKGIKNKAEAEKWLATNFDGKCGISNLTEEQLTKAIELAK